MMPSAESEIVSPLSYSDIDRICRVARILKVAVCSGCGITVYRQSIHLPLIARGWYCAECCPCRTVELSDAELAAIRQNRRAALRQTTTASEAAKRRWLDPDYRRRISKAWKARRATAGR